jgi:hypothetical protein
MKLNGTTYQSYLLRLWCEKDGGEWRASIENVATRECHNFSNMTSLFAFLCRQAGQSILSINPGDLDIYRAKSIPTPVFIEYSKEEV